MSREFKAETIYHSLAWKKVLEKTYGYTPFYYGYQGGEDVKVAVMRYTSFILRKKILASLPFSDEVPPLLKDASHAEKAFSLYHKLFENEKADYIEIKGLGPEMYATSSHYGFVKINPNYRFVLYLTNSV